MMDDERSFMMLRRVQNGLVAMTEYDQERVEAIPMFADVRADVWMPRTFPRHRLYFVLLGIVARNQDRWRTAEDLHTAIKIRLGYLDHMEFENGRLILCPRSTAFNSMDEIEFRLFFEQALEVISTEIIPGLDTQALIEEGRRVTGVRNALPHH